MSNRILDEFPNYDYRHPTRPWLLSYSNKESTAGLQIQAFHYWWAIQSGKTGQIGLSLITPNLPFCFCVGQGDEEGIHLQANPLVAHTLLQRAPFPLIVVSAILPYLPCKEKEERKLRCQGEEIVGHLLLWRELLSPNGRIIGSLMDENYARKGGWSVKEKLKATHSWNAIGFYDQIRYLLQENLFELEEFDTLKNEFAFNFVLSRKDQ